MTNTRAHPVELTDVLAEAREDAAVLRRRGHASDAELLEQMVDRVSRAASDMLTWWSEEDAAAAAGWTLTKVRKHAKAFAHTDHVRYERRRYLLRAVIVPRALPASIVRAAGARAA